MRVRNKISRFVFQCMYLLQPNYVSIFFFCVQRLELYDNDVYIAHYSKSQIFVQKFNFDKTTTFSRVFHPNCFWQFFSWNQSCQQLKSPKPQHFHEFFTQKNRQFSQEIKVEFLDKKWRFRTVCSSRFTRCRNICRHSPLNLAQWICARPDGRR